MRRTKLSKDRLLDKASNLGSVEPIVMTESDQKAIWLPP